jgi:dolichyl-phosphate beta-glucosyltransferase
MPSDAESLLSLIVPIYNESERIREPLEEMGQFLAAQPFPTELVMVDDGSRDGTFEIVTEIASHLPVRVRAIRYNVNRGKGYALKVGFAAASGERLLFTDCDLSTPLDEMPRFLAALDEGHDFVIGSRKKAGAEITTHQPWLRERLGMVFTAIVRTLIADVTDVTCGFKAYRRGPGQDIFSRLRVEDWSFDAELLLLAQRRNYRFCEVPVRWEHRDGSRVNIVRDVLKSLIGIAQIRINAALGRYEEPVDVDPWNEDWCNGIESVESGSLRGSRGS